MVAMASLLLMPLAFSVAPPKVQQKENNYVSSSRACGLQLRQNSELNIVRGRVLRRAVSMWGFSTTESPGKKMLKGWPSGQEVPFISVHLHNVEMPTFTAQAASTAFNFPLHILLVQQFLSTAALDLVPSIVVYATVPNKETWTKLAHSFIKNKLAACVNQIPDHTHNIFTLIGYGYIENPDHQSKQTIPHYYLSLELRVDKLLEMRAELNATLEATKKKDTPPKKLSLNDFVIKAAALALKKVPEVNSSWTDEYIRQYNNVNVSVAVQTDHGLMVPVVKDADKKGLSAITDDIKALAGKARSNTLKPTDDEERHDEAIRVLEKIYLRREDAHAQ